RELPGEARPNGVDDLHVTASARWLGIGSRGLRGIRAFLARGLQIDLHRRRMRSRVPAEQRGAPAGNAHVRHDGCQLTRLEVLPDQRLDTDDHLLRLFDAGTERRPERDAELILV